MTTQHLRKYFKDLIVTRAKNFIAVELSKYSFNEIGQHLNDISEGVASQVKADIADYGIEIFNFFVSEVVINPADLEKLKQLDNSMTVKRFEALGNRDATVIEAEGQAKARELQGYTWQQEKQFDVSKSFAQNEGFAANPANMMAQVPLAFSMGNMIKDNVDQSVTAQKMEPKQGLKCSKCGAVLMDNAKFCMECGEKVTVPKQAFCIECGQALPEGAKFCPSCGRGQQA
jgi:RNA polymerase subunit RPABC4/transcription elongation factor Spt4